MTIESTDVRLARLETKVDALNERLNELFISQVKDHGKRIRIIENRLAWAAGWAACAGVAGAGVMAAIMKAVGV